MEKTKMRQNDGKLYSEIRKQHEKSCEAQSNPYGALSVNTAGIWAELDMAEQEFPVRFATDGEIVVNGKAAYEWFEKWFGTWAKAHPEFFHSIKRDCQHRLVKTEDCGFPTWIECEKHIDLAIYDCCSNCNQYSPVNGKLSGE